MIKYFWIEKIQGINIYGQFWKAQKDIENSPWVVEWHHIVPENYFSYRSSNEKSGHPSDTVQISEPEQIEPFEISSKNLKRFDNFSTSAYDVYTGPAEVSKCVFPRVTGKPEKNGKFPKVN